MVKTILLTGAAGIVGSLIRPLLSQRYSHVVLTDIVGIDDAVENESFLRGDIADPEFVHRAAGDVDGIVHLAGMVGPDYSFDDVLGPNIIGTHNVFNAARNQGVGRVVYASSHHAVGYYRRDQGIDDQAAPRPDSQYGLSKAFGESAGSYFWDKFGIHVLAIRIGYVGPQAIDERRLHTWVSPRDLAQLIDIGLRTPNLGFEVVYGVSGNPAPFFNNANAIRLGYRPMDRATDHLADEGIATEQPDPRTLEGTMIGGPFASLGFVGHPNRLLRFGEKET